MAAIDELSHWNPVEAMPDHFLILIYGLRRSGKSVLMRQLLYDIWPKIQNHKVYLFSNTAAVNKEQYDYFPGDYMITDCKDMEPILRQIVDDQKEIIKTQEAQIGDGSKKGKGGNAAPRKQKTSSVEMREKKRKESKMGKGSADKGKSGDARQDQDPESATLNGYKDVLLIFDDCCSEHAVRNSPSLGFLATCGRHIRASVIILSQVVAGSASVPPVVRTQSDFIIVVAQPRSMRERQLIAEQYLTAENRNHAKQRGLQTMEMITTTPYRAMIIDTNNTSARGMEEYVFYYGPVPFPFPHEKWRVGLDDQWREEQEEEKYDHDFFKTHKKQKTQNLPQTDRPSTLQTASNFETNFKTALFKAQKVPFRLKTPYDSSANKFKG
jgi:hypothetical protein